MDKKKNIIILSAVLGIVIAAVAIYMFWPKNEEKPNQTVDSIEEESLFNISVFDMDRGYINDKELIERIKLECSPYAESLDAETAFYTEDGNNLYTYLWCDEYTEVVIYLNLEDDIIRFEVRDVYVPEFDEDYEGGL